MRIPRSRRAAGPSAARAVHQLVPRLAWGDAVGNQVRYLRELLRSWGYASEIYADQWDEECRPLVRPAKDYPREADDSSALIIHHSFESRLVPLIARSPGRKAVVYHNVTPARLFEGFERKVAQACEAARDELLAMRPMVECAWAYSRFSAEELVAAGYPHVSVLPFAVDWRAFDVEPDPVLRAELDDGCANLLFVGRAVPSKRVDDVLRVFTAWQRLYQPRSRLLVAGYLNRETPYGAYLYGLKEMLGAERVQFLGRVSAAQLSACFSVASAYLSMSRHEGFGVPLLEAMYRGVPVVAYGAAAVPETMGGAGVASLTNDPLEIARLLAVLERDPALRREMVAAQRARVEQLGQDAVAEAVREGLQPFLEGTLRAPATGSGASGVNLVCPGFVAAPEAPASELARRLVEQLPGARLLTLDPQPRPVELAPRSLRVGGLEVRAFTPDEPLPRDASRELPGSSSLETALRASRVPTVFLPADSLLARDTLPHLSAEAWGVRDTSRPLSAPDVGERLGQRLLTFDPSRPEPTVSALVQALRATGALRAS
ncbi:MAG TPA: glycosyltransferase [Archangium sp.]|uniref:glycosyltransferase n=1 Tax=Archangium sp. TaxID=1872627 RepID=UPI002E2FA8CB|nr:glycosyltransferase [Archangium sp.]HEX5747923.1 glycosyltransferase [Archangium sp.]